MLFPRSGVHFSSSVTVSSCSWPLSFTLTGRRKNWASLSATRTLHWRNDSDPCEVVINWCQSFSAVCPCATRISFLISSYICASHGHDRFEFCSDHCSSKAPFTRRRCENETESLRIVSDTIVFGKNDRRVFTRRRCRDVQRRLRLVRRRSRASFVARRRLQNLNMRGLGHCAPQTHRDSTGVSKCIEERASACY